jgi:hypothetical protein
MSVGVITVAPREDAMHVGIEHKLADVAALYSSS